MELFSENESRNEEDSRGSPRSSDKEYLEKLFDNLIEFIYTGDIGVEQDCSNELLYLMILAESFQVLDLKKRWLLIIRCEETLINQIDSENVLNLLILLHKSELEGSELEDRLKKSFYNNFRKIKQNNPDLEKEIYQQSGLMLKLFDHVSGRGKGFSRKVTFMVD